MSMNGCEVCGGIVRPMWWELNENLASDDVIHLETRRVFCGTACLVTWLLTHAHQWVGEVGEVEPQALREAIGAFQASRARSA